MHVLSDDYAEVWVNGHQVDRDIFPHTDTYWNRKAKLVKDFWLKNGTNVVTDDLLPDLKAGTSLSKA